MDTQFLEQYYETVILPFYKQAISFTTIIWKDHGKVGLDTWAHYFEDEAGREFVLLYEDFPGNEYLVDSMTHDIVPCGSEMSLRILSNPQKTIDNLLGYFTLYAENNLSATASMSRNGTEP